MCAIFVVLTIRQRANDLQRWSLISIPKVFFFFFHHEHVIHEWWPGCFRRVTAFSPFVSQNDTTREMYCRVLFIRYSVLIFIFTWWYCNFLCSTMHNVIDNAQCDEQRWWFTHMYLRNTENQVGNNSDFVLYARYHCSSESQYRVPGRSYRKKVYPFCISVKHSSSCPDFK